MHLTKGMKETLEALHTGMTERPMLKSAWGKPTIEALEKRGLITVRDYDGEIRVTSQGEATLFELWATQPRHEDHGEIQIRIGEFKNQATSGGPGMGDQDWLVNITASRDGEYLDNETVPGHEHWDPEKSNRLGQKGAFTIEPPTEAEIDAAKARLLDRLK